MDNQDIFVGTPGVIDYTKIENLNRNIMLITASCGRGKTYYALHQLLDAINAEGRQRDTTWEDILPYQALFLTSRKVIKQQQMKDDGVVAAELEDYNGAYEMPRYPHCISIATAHQFGYWVKTATIINVPRLIILDEFHSILGETIFAEQLIYTLEFIKEHSVQIIKFALTATSDFVLNYENDVGFNYQVIDKDLGPKYKCGKIIVSVHGEASTLFDALYPRLNSENKAIFYRQSARGCYALWKQYGEKTAFLISDYNESTDDETGEKYVDTMMRAGVKNYIIQNERLPDDINAVFLNSACREGMNLKNDKVNIIICEAVDMVTIEQILGRVRGNIDAFYVVCNNVKRDQHWKTCQAWVEFTNSVAAAEDKQAALARRYEEQEKESGLPKFVYEYRGEYHINRYAEGFLKYVYDCYKQINHEYECLSDTGHALMNYKGYLTNGLQKYSDMPLRIGKGVVVNKDARIGGLILNEKWLDKPLFKEDLAILCDEVSPIRSDNREGGWKTLKEQLKHDGIYDVKETKRENPQIPGNPQRRCVIITKK